MRQFIERLLSRKLLVVAVAAVACWLGVPGLGGEELQQIFMTYIGGQAAVDAAKVLKT
tara:strand:+ start:506 stop:679 length:174 start_codon:yes stop_codon:yes gene_type:complete